MSDPPAEVIYLRDEDSGSTWTPTPLPIREAQGYMIRHGQGYSVFEHASHGISQELLVFAPLDAPVRISLLRLRNRSDRRRRLTVTSYQELVLGVTREASASHVVTDVEEGEGAIFARNSFNNEFSNRVTFVGTSESRFTITCDRKEFIGRNGSLARPAALRRVGLGGFDGAGLDPCAAIQTPIELAPGEAREVIILLGEAESIEEARDLNRRFLPCVDPFDARLCPEPGQLPLCETASISLYQLDCHGQVHLACEMLGRGCEPETAAEILL